MEWAMFHGRALIVTLALILLAYFGGYLVLSTPCRCSMGHGGGGVSWVEPDYRLVGDAGEEFFRPLELLDRRVRPGFWATKHFSYEIKWKDVTYFESDSAPK